MKKLITIIFVLVILTTLCSTVAQAATVTTSGSGNWSSTTPNAPWPGGTIPATTDDIVIGNAYTLTVDGNRTCNSISFTAPASGTGSGTLTVNSGVLLTVTTVVSAPATGIATKITGTYTISGLGAISCENLNCNNTETPSGRGSTSITLISTISTLTISGNLTLNATYTSASSKVNNPIFNLRSGTVTVNGSVTSVNQNAINVSKLDMVTSAASPTLVLAGATPFNLSGTGTNTIDLNGTGATVNYSNAVAQTVRGTAYTNLTLSGGGTKTLQTGTTEIGGNLTLSGTATTTTVVGLTINGNLSVGDGTTFNAAGFDLTVTGNTAVGAGTSGNLTISSATGAKLFTDLVTINAGGIWNNSGNSTVTFRGGITNNATFTAGSGIQTFSTNSQVLTGAFSIPNVTVTEVTLTNNNTLTVSTALAGTGGLTNAATGTLNINFTGVTGITTLTATASGNTVNYGFAGTQTVFATNYHHLTFSNAGVKTFPSGTTGITGNFTISDAATGDATTNNTTINYNGSGAQNAGAINYNNLTFSNAGVKTFSAGTTGIAGVFTISGTATGDATTNNTTINYN
ncbi:MAG: hypothetical protein Q7U47_03035, partial [Paludibacter sp.]|nr:hypothetical protein [Paludibacter sp.]